MEQRRVDFRVSPSPRRSFLHIALLSIAMAAVAWGAFAFGAVYPWAFTPLAAVCAVVGVAGLATGETGRPPLGALAAALVVVGLAVAFQIIPLPSAIVARLSPAADALMRPGDIPASALSTRQTLSIVPEKTLIGLALFVSLALFLLGSSRLISSVGAYPVAVFILAVGVLLSVIGMVQDALTVNDVYPLIYGFWKPQGGRPFGPFVNRNHFAGWMLMALPVGLATAADAIMRTGHAVPVTQRDEYVRSVNSSDFARPLFVASALVVMGAALLLTRSRSGVVAFAAGTVLVAAAVYRRQRTQRQRAGILVAFAVLVLGSVMWAGLDNAVGKFFERSTIPSAVGGRTGAWKDTLEIIRDFPLTGAGLNSYGSAMTLYQSDSRELHYQEAHNDYLQIAAEGGVLVGVPVLLAVGIFVRDVRRRFREAPKEGTTYWLRVGAVVGMIAIALQSVVEFSLQMPGNAAMFALLAAVAIHRSPNLRVAHADQRSGR